MIVASVLGSTWAIVGGVVVGIGVLTALWKAVGRGAEGIVLFNKKFVPNVQYMDLLPKLDQILTVQEEIAAQFRSDSGSTLKDTTNRLEGHAQENRQAAADAKQAAIEARQVAVDAAASTKALEASIKALEVLVSMVRELAKEDRLLAQNVYQKMLSLLDSAERTEASGARIEADRALVAGELAATQKRADDVEASEPPGTAADAASQSPEDPDDSR